MLKLGCKKHVKRQLKKMMLEFNEDKIRNQHRGKQPILPNHENIVSPRDYGKPFFK